MLNYWWVTRPKRRLNSIPETLATFVEIALNKEWEGQRNSHLSLEDALEEAGLKKAGQRRDQTGGGGRTYQAWLESLGLIFIQENTEKVKLTLAGEAIMAGDSPVSVLTSQILKYQFPSSFSLSRGVQVSARFRIRPFRFLLRLLSDSRIGWLTEEELAKIIITEAENESEACYEYIVRRILQFRSDGDACLDKDFAVKYASSRRVNLVNPFSHLMDVANTFVNWLEYTQLARRDEQRCIRIFDEKQESVRRILAAKLSFIPRADEHEFFQRKYGVDPKHTKDTRDLTGVANVSTKAIVEQKIKNAFLAESLKTPISQITASLIDKICEQTGLISHIVEDTLNRLYPHGAIGAFMTEYFEMAFKGREDAAEFEKATAALFQDAFGFEAKHVGPIGLTPDVLLLSNESGFQAILDNKAYSKYSISNDHKNRMIHNYINELQNYSSSHLPLAFFSYIAGGFGSNITSRLQEISSETSVPGSAIGVANMIQLIERNIENPYSHSRIREIFSCGHLIELKDL